MEPYLVKENIILSDEEIIFNDEKED